MEVVLSIGSNLGDRVANIRLAAQQLNATPDTRLLTLSHLYESDHIGPSSTQAPPPFINCIALIATTLSPTALLPELHKIEQTMGRIRQSETPAGSPRTLDIDIIAWGDLALDLPELTIPHPRAHLRRFVLQPLADLRPDQVLPGQKLSVAELLHNLPPQKCEKIG